MNTPTIQEPPKLTHVISPSVDTVIFYHAGCMDGILSASTYQLFLKNTTKSESVLVPLHYNQYENIDAVLLALWPKMVVFCDITPNTEVIVQTARTMGKMAPSKGEAGTKRIFFIDHHPGADESIRKAINSLSAEELKRVRLLVNFKNDYSACGIVKTIFDMTAQPLTEQMEKLLTVASNYDLWKHDGVIDTPETALSLVFYKHYTPHRKAIADNLRVFLSGAAMGYGYNQLSLATIQTHLKDVFEKTLAEFDDKDITFDLTYKLGERVLAQEAKIFVAEINTEKHGVMAFVIGDFDPDLRNETAALARTYDKQLAGLFQFRHLDNGDLKFSCRTGNWILTTTADQVDHEFQMDMNEFAKFAYDGGGHAGASAFTVSHDTHAAQSASLTVVPIGSDVVAKIAAWMANKGITIKSIKTKPSTWAAWVGDSGENYRSENDLDLL